MTDGPRVLLMVLSERTSSRGTTYLSCWLGKAKVVAFRGKEPDKFGNPTWDVFLAEPQQREQQRHLPPRKNPPAVIDGHYRDISDSEDRHGECGRSRAHRQDPRP